MPGDTTVHVQKCIDRLQAGDEAAQGELFQHAEERLRRLTHRMLGNFERVHTFEETADVQQNASLRLLRTLKAVPINSAKDFFRLAATQIRRELIDLSRHYYGPGGAGRRQVGGEPDMQLDGSGMTWNGERIAVWTEFHTAVENLPESEREVVDLLWYQGLEQSNAASILGVSVPTIKRRWMRARQQLQANWPGRMPRL
ncbi:MAG: sigma-70 family RNA polymerase sigma factor [Gemmataceae bacterium]